MSVQTALSDQAPPQEHTHSDLLTQVLDRLQSYSRSNPIGPDGHKLMIELAAKLKTDRTLQDLFEDALIELGERYEVIQELVRTGLGLAADFDHLGAYDYDPYKPIISHRLGRIIEVVLELTARETAMIIRGRHRWKSERFNYQPARLQPMLTTAKS